MTAGEFQRWLLNAKKGEKIRYFRGFTGDLMNRADALRRATSKAYIAEQVTLVQKRTGIIRNMGDVLHNEFDYYAIRR